ncbi:hypothetical protein GGR57DRAFT_319186 [Xylariaceae sp. FL1272]|nr:hypothetical protein GGR57DRAFT_319186 [Xylariaceae sp. FL1272]
MDPLSIIGGIGAGIQVVSMGAQALMITIKLLKDLQDIPQRLLLLLNDVDSSISRLCYSCNTGSRLFRMLDPPQLDRLSRTATALYPALQDIQRLLEPLIHGAQLHKRPVRRLWNSILSLKVEKELSEKLKRVNRLNLELVRELGTVGLEVQVETNGLVIASHATSVQAFSNIETKMDLLRDDFQKYTSSMHRAYEIDHNVSAGHIPNTSRETATSFPGFYRHTEDYPLSQDRTEQLSKILVTKATDPAPYTPVSSSLPDAQLELILFSVRTYYTVGNFDTTSRLKKPRLWKDTDLAIYLLKVSNDTQREKSESQTRAYRLLKNTTADAFDTMDLGTPNTLIELLSILSPTNTIACPYVREGLIQYLSWSAERSLPKGHPIAIIINKLKNDEGDASITLRTLEFIMDRLRITVGTTHELTQLATKRLCALLRRSHDHAGALRVAREGVIGIRAALGPHSLPERTLSRQLEHIYIDQHNWTVALGVCFDIVGQQQHDSPNPDPRFHDECAVYTMEDIAKIFQSVGNLEQAISWLKQALISGGMIWNSIDTEHELGHVQDKLIDLLELTGKTSETELWQSIC